MISKYIQKMRSGRIHKGDWQLLVNEDWMGLTLDVRGSVDTISSRWKNCCSQIITSTRSFSPLLFLTFLTLSFLSSVFSTFNFCLLFVQVPVLDWNRRPPTDSTLAHSSSLFFYCFRCRSGDYLALYSSWVLPHFQFQTALLCFGRAHMKFPSESALDWRDSRCTGAGPTGLSNGNRIIRLIVRQISLYFHYPFSKIAYQYLDIDYFNFPV